MKIFIFLVFIVLSLLWSYVGLSLIVPLVWGTDWAWLGATFLIGTFLLQVWRWTQMQKAEKYPRVLLAAYFSLGLICHLLVAAVLKDFVQIWTTVPNAAILMLIFASLLLNIKSLWVAFQGPIIRSVQIKSGIEGQPVKILQISDLHVGPIIQKEYVEKVVAMVLNEKPDLIFATGDIGDGSVSELHEDLAPLAKLTKNIPSFYVPGNHEYYWNGPAWIEKMEQLGFKALINQGQELLLEGKIPLWLGGVPDPQGERFVPSHKTDPQLAIKDLNNQNLYKILLAHRPQTCFEAKKAGFDLMVCGHTHGGQFFPFTLLVGLFNPYSRGLNDHKGMKVYVNLGTGYWGPPLRLGATSEITRIEII